MEQTAVLVEQDLPCLVCGYNLRALPVLGNCPECGSPVLRSIRGDLLRYANETWVKRVQLGLRLVHWSLLVLVASLVFTFLGMLLNSLFESRGGEGMLSFGAMTIAAGIVLIGWPVATMVGWWLATTKDPADAETLGMERIALRITGILVLPVFALWVNPHVFVAPAAWMDAAIEAVTLLCFALVWLHLYLLVRFVVTVNRRCSPAEEDWQKHRDTAPTRLRRYVRWVPLFPLLFHGVAILATRNDPTSSLAPYAWGNGVGYVIMMLVWLVIIANVETTLRCIRAERIAAAYQDDSEDFSGVGELGSAVPHSEHAAELPDSDRS